MDVNQKSLTQLEFGCGPVFDYYVTCEGHFSEGFMVFVINVSFASQLLVLHMISITAQQRVWLAFLC